MSPVTPRRRIPIAVATAVAALAIVAAAGLWIVATPSWSAHEVRIVAAVHGAANLGLDVIALTINTMFGTAGATSIVVLTVIWLVLLGRGWRRAALLVLVVVVPWTCAEGVKLLVARSRPDPQFVGELIVREPSSYSFPSGHTAFAAALVCALILVFIRGSARIVAIAVGALLVAVTAWSRVYLGVHYPTDVVASMLLVPPIAVATHGLLQGRAMFQRPEPSDPWLVAHPHDREPHHSR
jgi:undecaprenyl-diphosphatase